MIESLCVVCNHVIYDYHLRKVCGPKCQAANMRGKRNPSFKGGKSVYTNGGDGRGHYQQVYLLGRGRKLPEHRAIVENVYGKLPVGAQVHHINGNSLDNRPGNLLVCTTSYHRWLHEEMARRYMGEHFS